MSSAGEIRFEFGRNWQRFIRHNFTQERCEIAKQRLLQFAERDSLQGFDFLDIGCGSGLHSLAAYQAGANRILAFDYDENSVAATQTVRRYAGNPTNWNVERGDVLDTEYLAKLGKWNFVYSWGVLHHTGNMWQAIHNAQGTVAEGGYFYIALYSADADIRPSKEFWLQVKREYNKAGWFGRKKWELWYIWNSHLGRRPWRVPAFLHRIATYRLQRGMSLFADLRDWLGGWPMEYAPDQAVVDHLEQEYGFTLANVATGEACSEFLFIRSGTPNERTIVTQFVARKRTPDLRLLSKGSGDIIALHPPFAHQTGHSFIAYIPELAAEGDTPAKPKNSPILLQEDGEWIGVPHCAHVEISKAGYGRYSHWGGNLYFSTSDNSDPNTNNRKYSVLVPK